MDLKDLLDVVDVRVRAEELDSEAEEVCIDDDGECTEPEEVGRGGVMQVLEYARGQQVVERMKLGCIIQDLPRPPSDDKKQACILQGMNTYIHIYIYIINMNSKIARKE